MQIPYSFDYFYGTVAFIATSLNAMLTILLIFKITLNPDRLVKRISFAFFSSAIIMQLAWLIYLLKLHDVFVSTAIMLQLVSSMAFFFQFVFLSFRKQKIKKAKG